MKLLQTFFYSENIANWTELRMVQIVFQSRAWFFIAKFFAKYFIKKENTSIYETQ